MRIVLLGLLVLCSVLISCDFDRDEDDVNAACFSDCISIQGRLVQGVNQVPVQGIFLEFGWEHININVLNNGRLIATSFTDENGEFSFSFEPKDEELEKGLFYLQEPGWESADFPFRIDFGDFESSDTVINMVFKYQEIVDVQLSLQGFTVADQTNFWSFSGHYPQLNGLARVQFDGSTYFDSGNHPTGFDEIELSGSAALDDYLIFCSTLSVAGEEIEVIDSVLVTSESRQFDIPFSP